MKKAKISVFMSLVLCVLLPASSLIPIAKAQTVSEPMTEAVAGPVLEAVPVPTDPVVLPAPAPDPSIDPQPPTEPQPQPSADPQSDPSDVEPSDGTQPLLGSDTTPPRLLFVLWLDNDNSLTFTGGDMFTFLFSEAIASSTITGDTADAHLGLNNGHSFGTTANGLHVNWDNSDTSLLDVILGSDRTVQNGDTVNPTNDVTDIAGNPDATSQNIVLSTGQTVTHTISASAGFGGSIAPNGAVQVNDGANQTFDIIPNGGYQVNDVTVDGSYVGTTTQFTFSTVRADHAIAATFSPIGIGNHPPVITILGDNPMTVIKNTPFNDPGATATDTEDGNLSDQIQNSGIVHVETVGTYIKTYTVMDSGFLSDTKTRIVNVVEASSTNPDNPPPPPPARHRHRVTTGGYINGFRGIPAVLGAETSIYDVRNEIARIIIQNQQLIMLLKNEGYRIPDSILKILNQNYSVA